MSNIKSVIANTENLTLQTVIDVCNFLQAGNTAKVEVYSSYSAIYPNTTHFEFNAETNTLTITSYSI